MGRPQQDQYANMANIALTESAAGTLTFIELVTGISLGQGTGMLIDSVEYFLDDTTIEDLIATGDVVRIGLATSNSGANFTISERTTIHLAEMRAGPIIGTPASAGWVFVQPLKFDFFPSIIIAAPRIYGAIVSASLGQPAAGDLRFYFRYIDLTDKEYLELAESFILVG